MTGERVDMRSTSTDAPDGTVASQAWDLDDDGAFDDGTGDQASRVFPAAGSYTVRLRVTDDDGASHVTSRSVAVRPEAQVSGSTLSYSAGSGESNSVTVSGSGGTTRSVTRAPRFGPAQAARPSTRTRCAAPVGPSRRSTLDVGDGDDSATNQSSLASTIAGGTGPTP